MFLRLFMQAGALASSQFSARLAFLLRYEHLPVGREGTFSQYLYASLRSVSSRVLCAMSSVNLFGKLFGCS